MNVREIARKNSGKQVVVKTPCSELGTFMTSEGFKLIGDMEEEEAKTTLEALLYLNLIDVHDFEKYRDCLERYGFYKHPLTGE